MKPTHEYKLTSNLSLLVRAYCTGIGKTSVIYPSAFAVALAVNCLALGLVYYARRMFDASRAQIGVLTGIWALTYILGCLLLRPRFDRIPPRFLMLISSVLMALFVTAMLFSRSVGMLIASYAAMGFTLSLFWPPVMGWLSADFEGSELSRVIARYNFAWCSGSILGPLAGGWLGRIRVALPLQASALILFGVAIFIAGAAIVLPLIRSDRRTGTSADRIEGAWDRSTPLRFPAWIGLFGAFIGMGVFASVFPLAGIETWSMHETTIGLVFTLRGLANTVGFILLGRYAWWHFRRGPMLMAQGLTVFVFFAMSTSRTSGTVMLLMVLFGASAAMSYTGSVFHGASGSLNRARRMVIHEAVLSTGLVCGAMGGGWLYERLPVSAAFRIVALAMAVLWLAQLVAGIFVPQHGKTHSEADRDSARKHTLRKSV